MTTEEKARLDVALETRNDILANLRIHVDYEEASRLMRAVNTMADAARAYRAMMDVPQHSEPQAIKVLRKAHRDGVMITGMSEDSVSLILEAYDTVSRSVPMLRQRIRELEEIAVQPIGGITLGSDLEGKITEAEALELVNGVIQSQHEGNRSYRALPDASEDAESPPCVSCGAPSNTSTPDDAEMCWRCYGEFNAACVDELKALLKDARDRLEVLTLGKTLDHPARRCMARIDAVLKLTRED